MVAGTARDARTTLLPSGSGPFFARRLSELAGLALCAIAVIVGAALATYSAADPSFNSAGDVAPANLIGRPGAYGADLLLQWLGIGAGLLPLILGAWAWALIGHRGLSRQLVRFAMAPLAVLLTAVGCASLGLADWPAAAGAGGAAGGILLAQLGTVGLGGTGMVTAVIGAVFLTAAALALVVALGVPWREWRVLLRSVYWLLRQSVLAVLWLGLWTSSRAGERAEPEERSEDEERPRAGALAAVRRTGRGEARSRESARAQPAAAGAGRSRNRGSARRSPPLSRSAGAR